MNRDLGLCAAWSDGPGNEAMISLVSCDATSQVFFSFLTPSEVWRMLIASYDSYVWGDVVTFNTSYERCNRSNFVESDPEVACGYRLWGYKFK